MRFTRILMATAALLGAFTMQSCKIEGCTDNKAINYDGKANTDDGSCKYKEGCTDVTAVNYDYQAGIDDGSCEFEGQAIFWTSQLGGSDTIRVSINGTPRGNITKTFNHPPDCGENGTVTIIMEPGKYGYYAQSNTGIHWEDSVTIYKNSCNDIRLE
jgi:hypothetical protein